MLRLTTLVGPSSGNEKAVGFFGLTPLICICKWGRLHKLFSKSQTFASAPHHQAMSATAISGTISDRKGSTLTKICSNRNLEIVACHGTTCLWVAFLENPEHEWNWLPKQWFMEGFFYTLWLILGTSGTFLYDSIAVSTFEHTGCHGASLRFSYKLSVLKLK